MRTIVFVALWVAIATVAGLAGYHIGARLAKDAKFEWLVQNVTTDLLLHDAIDSDRAREVTPVLKARLETNFFYLVEMLDEDKFRPRSPDLRCAITKHMRALQTRGKVLNDAKSLEDSGIALDVINGYLKHNCLGPPKQESLMPRLPPDRN